MKNTLKKALSLILAVSVLIFPSVTKTEAAAAFKDVKSTAWYSGYVTKLVELKITSGYSDGTFKPASTVTRAEFVTFLCKAAGHQPTQGNLFMDVGKHWASGYIAIALNNGIIDLTADKKFRPNAAITRLEAVEMLCRALNISKDSTTAINPYVDIKPTDSGYTNAAYESYLMQGELEKGKRYFRPSGNITRAEAAAVIVNASEYHADKMAYINKKAAAEKEKVDKEKAEQGRYAAWRESVKGMSPELMSNTHGLVKPFVYESYKYLRDIEKDYLKNWGAKYGMTPEQMEKEFVRVGSKFMNTWYNASYLKLSKLEIDLKSVWSSNDINNSLQKNIDYVKKNKFVSEGEFITSTGMLVFAEWGNPVLRGTMRYRYLAPTSTNVLNSEKIGATGKHIELESWYEQDFEITFLPENNGLKTTSMNTISDVRIDK